MKRFIYFLPLVATVFAISCSEVDTCEYDVNVQLLSAIPGDSINVIVADSIEYSKKFTAPFYISVKNRKYLIKNICINKDSFNIDLKFNNRDTSFYVYPKQINSVLVGELENSFDIVFEYRNPNENAPNSLGFD